MRMRMLHSTYVGAFLGAAGLMYVFFLYYSTSSNLRAAEAKLDKLTEINERLTAQQQVVVGHKQRLERSLDEAKERLVAAKEDSDKRFQSLKALKEELQQKLEQEGAARARVEEDGRRRAEQHSVEYQLLKQEKEATVAKLTNDLNSQKAETKRLQTEMDRLLAEAARLQRELDTAQAEARSAQATASSAASTVQELRKTVASLDAEVASLRSSAAAGLAVNGASAAARVPTTTSAQPADVGPAKLPVVEAAAVVAKFAKAAATTAAAAVRSDPVTVVAKPLQQDSLVELNLLPAGDPAVARVEDINLNEPPRQVALPLGLGGGGHKEDDERVADHLGAADDDDGDVGAGNRDEEDEEELDHALAHAKPERQVPAPQGAGLVERLRAAAAGRQQQRRAGASSTEPPPKAGGKLVADESMQVDRPPAVDDNSQAHIRDQEGNKLQANRPALQAAANNNLRPDEP